MSDKEAYDAFFGPLIADFERNRFPGKMGTPYEKDRGFEWQFGLSYRVGFWPEASAYLWIHAKGQRDRNQHIYRLLREAKTEIDLAMGVDLPLTKADWNPNTWRRSEGYAAVGVSTPGGINSPPARLREIREWMLKYLPRIKEVLDPRLEEILRQLGGP